MLRTSLIALAAATMASGGIAQQVRFYQDGRPERIFKPVSGVSAQDVRFLQEAAVANNFEIHSARLALRNGTGAWTQQFAKEMIGDHQAAQDETVQTAERRGVAVNGNMPRDLQRELNNLRDKNGGSFDRAYRDVQTRGHQEAIQVFKREIEGGHDQLIKGMAVKQLPTIMLHYRMLLSQRTQMGSTQMGHGM